jgi:hypothetical protein
MPAGARSRRSAAMTRVRGLTPAAASLALLAACGSGPDDLRDGVMTLPAALREVSGLAVADERTLACVQDERGAIWLLDTTGGAAARAVPFGPPGDYEGLARAGGDWWVLRSDGWLARVVVRGDALAIAATVTLPAGHGEWEALCADPERSRLLVMPKHGLRGEGAPGRRPLFAVELPAGTVAPEPVLVLDRDEVLARAGEVGLELAAKGNKGRRRLELAVSDILAVPGTRELLVLCSSDRLVLRFGDSGRLLGGQRLDEDVLPQPEGLALLPDGRLAVASEGRGGTARIAVVPMP